MRSPYMQFNPTEIHPVWRVVIGIVALGLLGALAAVGLVLFAILAGATLIAGAILWVRIWWLRRKFRKGRGGGEPGVIEGEYFVIRPRELDRDRDHHS